MKKMRGGIYIIQIKQRIAWVDMAKGYGMLIVIFAHLGVGPIRPWIYSFHMPLFFFLSGYVFNDKYDFKSFLKRKCKSIIIPYFCLGIPMLIFNGLRHYFVGDYNIEDYFYLFFRFIIQRRMWTLWFLACLFFLNILFYITKKCFSADIHLAMMAIVVTYLGILYYKNGGMALPWNIDVCLTAYPFFFAGFFYKERHEIFDKFLDNKKTSPLLFIGLGMINVILGYLTIKISGNGLEMYGSSYGFAPFTYLSAFAGIMCVVILSKWIAIKPVMYIGKNSLLYLAWHQTIMIPFSQELLSTIHVTINDSSSMINMLLYKLLQMILIVIALTILNLIISKSRLKFILGI